MLTLRQSPYLNRSITSNRGRCWLGDRRRFPVAGCLCPLRDSMCSERRNMSAVELLRVSVHDRISAAAEDFLLQVEEGGGKARVPELRAMLIERLMAAGDQILAGLEETLLKYEDHVEQSEREIRRHRKLFDAVMKPEVRLHRAGQSLEEPLTC
ncbi:unnamed protein product [Pleuronectes platessa]|uniref:Uncharacterized protein n=1 Tax=Pleuronectes platessa TaxID=8262 RepID=A0A9N7TT40_PLEPL|nr:unnamed protein product [Pleuronectes platessa]